MGETYQGVIAVAADPETAKIVRSALETLRSDFPSGTLAIGELQPAGANSTGASAAPEPAFSPQVELERLRRDIALGAVASRWRHTLNNSLAALLAEAQLFSMEPLAPEHEQAIQRIIALCRRMIVILREGPPAEPFDETAPDTAQSPAR
jgi:hypothetical protein